MKIAVSCNGNQIWAHFGHCENFMIYEAENGVITSEQSVPNPGHRPGFLPNFLADMGVAVIISGGMGGGAVDIFNERSVEVVLGAQGDAKTAGCFPQGSVLLGSTLMNAGILMESISGDYVGKLIHLTQVQ